MDRWLLSRLTAVSQRVTELYDAYNLTHAVREISDFVVDDLSNWYVRRSRDRFWGSADAADTRAAFATLHTALVDVTRLMAPVAPFIADWLHRSLTEESVHLARLPEGAAARDEVLEQGMEGVRRLANLGRAAREHVRIRVRQPLGAIHAVVPDGVALEPELVEILRDELNVRTVAFLEGADELVTFSAKPNFRALGARFGKATPKIAEAVRALSSEALGASRRAAPLKVEVDGERHTILDSELDIIQEASGEFIVEAESGYTVALDPTITPDLRAEGFARELVSRVQRLRKESGLDVADRIQLALSGSSELEQVFNEHRDFIMSETLAVDLRVGEVARGSVESRTVDLEGEEVVDGVSRVTRMEVG